MDKFDKETSRWAYQQILGHMDRQGVKRRHVTQEDVSVRVYDDLKNGNYEQDELLVWLNDLWKLHRRVNFLVETAPFDGISKGGGAISWNRRFGSRPDFPPSPDGDDDPATMDGGAAPMGLGWEDKAFLPYERQLKGERARFHNSNDAPKLRQAIEKLAGLYEATGRWRSAIKRLKELRDLNVSFKDDVFTADCELRLGIAYYRLRLAKESEIALRRGLAIVERRRVILGDSKTELRLWSYLGLARLRSDHPREASVIYHDKVERLVALHDSTYVTATFHHRRALIRKSLHHYELAHEDSSRALALRLACNAQFEVTRTLFYLGQLCAQQKRSRAAIAIWNLCEKRHMRLDDALGLARTQLELGRAYAQLAQGGRDPEEEIRCDIFEADITDEGMAAISALAKSYGVDPEDGLAISLRVGDLLDLAEESIEAVLASTAIADEPRLRLSAEAAREDLRRRKRQGSAVV